MTMVQATLIGIAICPAMIFAIATSVWLRGVARKFRLKRETTRANAQLVT